MVIGPKYIKQLYREASNAHCPSVRSHKLCSSHLCQSLQESSNYENLTNGTENLSNQSCAAIFLFASLLTNQGGSIATSQDCFLEQSLSQDSQLFTWEWTSYELRVGTPYKSTSPLSQSMFSVSTKDFTWLSGSIRAGALPQLCCVIIELCHHWAVSQLSC